MKRVFSFLFLMLLCLAAIPMVAAPQLGTSQRGWEVLRADYGYGTRWVDVTEQVRSLIQNDFLNFRVTNATLGVAPFPGRRKTLRLQLQDRNGLNRQVFFQENGLVRFRAFNRNPIGSLQITRAVYGAGNRWADVTARLNSQIRGDQLNLLVTNTTMGGDPAPYRSNTLRVDYTVGGRVSQVVVNEGDTLRLSGDMGGNPQGRLLINRAVYGAGNRWADVTARLNSQIRGNQLHMQVNNDTMGGDPAVDRPKTLRVDYTFDGRTDQVVVNEGDTLRLNASTGGNYQSRLQITRAVYGAGTRWADVTARLNSQVRGDQLNLLVTNDSMGGDPAVDRPKTLRVDYTFDGRTDQVVVNEGDTLRLSTSSGGNYQSRLQITRAVYGAGNRWADVTARLNSQIRGDQLNLLVTNDSMGGDPAVDRPKTLRVDYTFDGRTEQVVVNEGDTLRLNSASTGGNWGNNQSRLQITRAVYGAGNRWADVTARLNSQVRGDQLNLLVTNDSMGGDPAVDRPKTLRVDYTVDGRTNQVVVNEGDTLRLSTSAGGNYQSRLQITRAVYGAGNRWADVTARLNSQVRGDQLNLLVTNDSMGGDPAVDRPKTLRVDYTVDGRTNQVVVNEGDTLRLSSATTGGNWGNNQSRLQITRAVYGAGNRWADVTARLNSQVRGDQLNLLVTNDSMGGDPAQNQSKTLRVDYTVDGRTNQVVVNEGDTLRLNSGTIYGSPSAQQTLRCESVGEMRKYCRADTLGGVRLSRQISEAACIQGSTWGYTSRGIWVSNGCGADFELLAAGQSTGESVYTLIPSGTQLTVLTNEIIDSRIASPGQRFSAQMDADVVDSWGQVAIPRGSLVELVIQNANADGTDLTLDVDSVTVAGTRYFVSTGDLTQKGGQGLGANRKTATMVGGGALLGTLIGAIVGGGKGAAIGAAVGAGAGAGGVVLTRGKQVNVPAETTLNFRLDQDLSLMTGR